MLCRCSHHITSPGLFGRGGSLHSDDRRELIGKQVIDSDGIEIGYVIDADTRLIRLGEGPLGNVGLGRRFVRQIVDRVVLNGPATEIFSGLNVIDSAGEYAGIVRDTVESGDILDSLIIEDEEGTMLVVIMEDIQLIDEWIELRISGDELQAKQ